MSGVNWELITALVTLAATAVKLGPKVAAALKEMKAAQLVRMVDGAIIAAYENIVLPARLGGEDKLSLDTRRAAFEYASAQLTSECSSRMKPSEVRALLTTRLEALKREHVLDSSTEAMKGPAL